MYVSRRYLHLPLLVVLGCGRTPAASKIQPSDQDKAKYDEVEQRLSRFLDRGMVVSLSPKQVAQGDSLIFSGIALGAVDCANGAAISAGLRGLVAAGGGALSRHWDLPNQISLDGALGFYFGVARRLRVCPDETAQWQETLKLHADYMAAHSGQIGGGFKVPAEFDFVQRGVLSKLGLAGAPPHLQLDALIAEIAGWAEVVKKDHAACYRAHISWLAISTAEELGYKPNKLAFCAATKGLDLPVVDHWCGRGGLGEFLAGFKYNEWQYRHQRCPSWETPDGAGEEQPAVDYLVGWSELHN